MTFLAFQEIQVRALATMREQQERREKVAEGRRREVFTASASAAAAEGVLGELLENPFDL